MSTSFAQFHDGLTAIAEELADTYSELIEEARLRVNKSLSWPEGSASRMNEAVIANSLIALAIEIRTIYAGGSTPIEVTPEEEA